MLPAVIGRSRWSVAWRSVPPRPGRSKADSMKITPASEVPAVKPSIVTSGTATFFSRCERATRRLPAPFERAVRTYSSPSCSSTRPRTSTVKNAAFKKPNANHGSSRWVVQAVRPLQPVERFAIEQ